MRHKPYVYIFCCVLVLLVSATIIVSIVKEETGNEKLKVASHLGPIKEDEVWQSRSEPFMTIPFSKCWEIISDKMFRTNQDPSPILIVQPSSRCKDMYKDKWYIMYARGNPRVSRKNPTELPPVPQGFPFLKEVNLNNRPVYFYENTHGDWTVNFKCGGVYFDFEKSNFDYFLLEPHAGAQDHEVPEVFKDFIANIKCDEDRSDWTFAIMRLINEL